MIKNSFKLILFCLAGTALLCASPFSAQAKKSIPEKAVAPLVPEDIQKIETIGLYNGVSEGGFDPDLWAGSRRSRVSTLIKLLPAASETALMNKAALGVLLTGADTYQILNDVPVQDGADLLTLRLEKLLEAGAYKQAYEMYLQLEQAPYDERLARTGILATLFNGEKSNACLEVKTNKFNNMPFWVQLSAYCDASLSETPDERDLEILRGEDTQLFLKLVTEKDFLFPYSPQFYDSLNMTERAILAAEKKLDISGLPSLGIAEMPLSHIQVLLNHETLDPESRFALTARGVSYGLLNAETLEKLYAKLLREHKAAHTGNEDAVPENSWEQLPFYLDRLEQAPAEEQWSIFKKALEAGKNYRPAAFLPFMSLLRDMQDANPTLDELTRVYRIFTVGGIDIPRYWTEIVEQYEGADKDSETYLGLLAAAYMAQSDGSVLGSLPQTLTELQGGLPASVNNNLKIFMKNVDKPEKSATNNSAYEKDFYLTTVEDYVMHSVVVWDRSQKVQKSKAIGETILLSTLSVHGSALHKIYPELLRDILLSTENMGLTKLSKDLAIVAVLDSIN